MADGPGMAAPCRGHFCGHMRLKEVGPRQKGIRLRLSTGKRLPAVRQAADRQSVDFLDDCAAAGVDQQDAIIGVDVAIPC